jgi:hypothetical protein
MERNRLTLVAPENGVDVPNDDATNSSGVVTLQESGAPMLRLVPVDEGPFPDDAA